MPIPDSVTDNANEESCKIAAHALVMPLADAVASNNGYIIGAASSAVTRPQLNSQRQFGRNCRRPVDGGSGRGSVFDHWQRDGLAGDKRRPGAELRKE